MFHFNESSLNEESRRSVLRRVWLARRSLMSKPQRFKTEQFSGVMDLLLSGKDHGLFEMLERGVWWSGRETRGNLAATNQHLYFWALWDTAAFCVDNRLKTPLGPNIQTLSAIEKGIRGFERNLASKISKKVDEPLREPIHIMLNRPRMLITLLGNLERLFFNAYDGCAIALPPATKIVRTFFINNRKICEQWLKGLRLSIMRVALHCGLPADAWYHGEQLLKAFLSDRQKNQSKSVELDRGNFERAILMCAESAIAIGSEQRLMGLTHWANKLDLDINLSWLKGSTFQAAGKFERAIQPYRAYLHEEYNRRMEAGEDANALNMSEIFVKQQVAECYMQVSDWSSASSWLQDNSEFPQLGNLDYVRCLQQYDDLNFDTTRQVALEYLKSVPETTWRWPLMKQIADVRLILTKIDRSNKGLDMLDEVGRSMILAEGLHWPCDIKNEGISIMHGSSIARDSKNTQSKYQLYKVRARLAECRQLTTICRLAGSSAHTLLDQGKWERNNENFSRATMLFSNAKGLLKRDRGKMVDIDMMFKIVRQEAKCLAQQGKYYDAVRYLGQKTSERLRPHRPDAKFTQYDDEELSRALLNMVSWLEADWANLGPYLEPMSKGGDGNELCQSLENLVKAEQHMEDRTLVKTSLLYEAQQETVLGRVVQIA